MEFRALLTQRDEAGEVTNRVERLPIEHLPEGDVLVSVEWAGFNYKDGLCLGGLGNLVRSYPHVGGVDFAGRVIESRDARYHPGQAVILTGWRVGESHWGGFAERARVKADWLVPLPKRLSTRDSMVLGTAGLTVMLAVNRLRLLGIAPQSGEIVVTGAGGGVGSQAVMMLGRLGYRVVAISGRPELAEPLLRLGASEVLGRDAIMTQSGKVLDKERFAGAIDTVGGAMLPELLKKIRSDGAVAAVGNAAGVSFEASVIPFILRGVSLLGINSVTVPYEMRVALWDRLSSLFVAGAYERMVTEIGLAEIPTYAERILAGGVAGRVVINPRR
ncbi:putative quinone oxidoreductase, YhdH/YhfP family [Devosia enhydra]|uniref:Putative quinone oxidoreductase, YhdH/YhfP family n=1 Tax=Devosia enhydra TaxID=665118 RepID=A0A1K2HW86_9HYPH|nr:acryloyl-CoA reductase [Devosia enhydra]SFZ83147.1 putative quinone oxidoreductase, YhdH/YhfP family [Devosia enhydra]